MSETKPKIIVIYLSRADELLSIAVSYAALAAMIGVGVWLDSQPLQWLGAGLWLFGLMRLLSAIYRPMTPAEARAEIDHIEKGLAR